MTPPSPGTRPVWLLIGPTLAASLGAFLFTVTVGPEWSAIQADMNMSNIMTLWIFVAFLFAAGLAVLAGITLGRRWPTAVTLPAIALLTLGALLSALAPDSGFFVFSRALAGLGAGLAWGTTAALLVPMRAQRVPVMPLVAGTVLLSLVLGPVVGALLAQMATWRLPFMLALPVGALAFLVTAVGGIIALTQRTSKVD